MKKGDVVVGGLVPANQNASKTVHPVVSTFHHPASGFEAGFPFDGLGLFTTASDVGGEAKLLYGLTHLIKVVAFIQAQTLGLLRAGRRALHWDTVNGSPYQPHIVAMGPIHCQPHRNPLGFRQHTAFDARLTAVRGVGTGFQPTRQVDTVPGPAELARWNWRRPEIHQSDSSQSDLLCHYIAASPQPIWSPS